MAQHRTGLTDLLFGGLIISATALLVALPALCTPAYMGTAPGNSAQVRHQVTALPAAVLEVAADTDEPDGGAAHMSGPRFTFRATRVAGHGAGPVSWRRPDGISMARFFERAGRLACPSTAPPRSFA